MEKAFRVIYKFYKSQVTGNGIVPASHCLAILTLDEQRKPTWTDVSEEFEQHCRPLFDSTVRFNAMEKVEAMVPYSEDALTHISKRQLPAQGYMMMTVKEDTTPKVLPALRGFETGVFTPPPGLFKMAPKKEEEETS